MRLARTCSLAIALSSLTILGACSGSSGDQVATTSTSTTTAATTTSVAPATTMPAPTGAESSRAAARTLYDAWNADDRALAATVAEPAAIDELWPVAKGPYELYSGCDDGEFGTGGCMFRDRTTNHTIQVNTEHRQTGWVVTRVFFSVS